MAIRYKSGSFSDDTALHSQINTTPLVDVMLVLLIIFLITIPAVSASIAVKLPQEDNTKRELHPDNIILTVDANGAVYWQNDKLSSFHDLETQLQQVATLQPQPQVLIRGDRAANYEFVGRVIYTAQKAGIVRLGFITRPNL